VKLRIKPTAHWKKREVLWSATLNCSRLYVVRWSVQLLRHVELLSGSAVQLVYCRFYENLQLQRAHAFPMPLWRAAFERLTTALVLKWQKLRWTLTLQRHVQTNTRRDSVYVVMKTRYSWPSLVYLYCNWEGLCSLWGRNFITLNLEVIKRSRNPLTGQHDQRLLWLFFSPTTIFQSAPKHRVALHASTAALPFWSPSKCNLLLRRPPESLRLTRVTINHLIKTLWPLSVQCYHPLLRLFLNFGFFLSQQQRFSNTRQT